MTRLALLFIALLAGGVAPAQDFYDPMRPPPLALQKYRLEKLKNQPPAKTAVTARSTKPAWELNSILLSEQRQHAIINNTLVRKGGIVDGAKLVKIEPGSVRLVQRGKVIKLSLPAKKQTVKKSRNEN